MGITIDDALECLEGSCNQCDRRDCISAESNEMSIEIMRKYQKIEKMKADILFDIYMSGINMAGEYKGCYVRFKDIENIVNGHFKKVE